MGEAAIQALRETLEQKKRSLRQLKEESKMTIYKRSTRGKNRRIERLVYEMERKTWIEN